MAYPQIEDRRESEGFSLKDTQNSNIKLKASDLKGFAGENPAWQLLEFKRCVTDCRISAIIIVGAL